MFRNQEQMLLFPVETEGVHPTENTEPQYEDSAPLYAYWASGLTGLNKTEKATVDAWGELADAVCKEHGIHLYLPGRHTDPGNNPDIEDGAVYALDRRKVTGSDLLLLLCRYPSLGAGQEYEIAMGRGIPTILLQMVDERISRMVTGAPSQRTIIRFDCADSLKKQLREILAETRLNLLERRKLLRELTLPAIGKKVATIRQERGMDREHLAQRTFLCVEFIKALETLPVSETNPTSTQLRLIAHALGVEPSELLNTSDVSPIRFHSNIRPEIRRLAKRKGLSEAEIYEFAQFAARESPTATSLNDFECDQMYDRFCQYQRHFSR
jgi:transcriptional regulator with XRE-family HTH domain